MRLFGGIGRFHRDARLFLVTTVVFGGALSLYWIDFNLYIASLGFEPATIGVVATVGSTAGALAAFPASAVSDRLGRRAVMAGGLLVAIAAVIGLLLVDALAAILVFAAMWAAGQQALMVVQAPFLAEHSDPEHRNELFAAQSAIFTMTNVLAAVLGGVVATAIAGLAGFDPGGPETYRVILVIMAVLLVAALATIGLLTDDRPRSRGGPEGLRRLGEPARYP